MYPRSERYKTGRGLRIWTVNSALPLWELGRWQQHLPPRSVKRNKGGTHTKCLTQSKPRVSGLMTLWMSNCNRNDGFGFIGAHALHSVNVSWIYFECRVWHCWDLFSGILFTRTQQVGWILTPSMGLLTPQLCWTVSPHLSTTACTLLSSWQLTVVSTWQRPSRVYFSTTNILLPF